MKISYAICVCNEHTELNALLSFLTDVIDNEDEINILVDSLIKSYPFSIFCI